MKISRYEYIIYIHTVVFDIALLPQHRSAHHHITDITEPLWVKALLKVPT